MSSQPKRKRKQSELQNIISPSTTRIDRSGMTSIEIDMLMNSLLAAATETTGNSLSPIHFLGVFPFDLFPITAFFQTSSTGSLSSLLSSHYLYHARPSNNKDSVCCIVNTDPATEPGTHWIAFFLAHNNRSSEIEFFDSYGLPPSFYGFSFPSPSHTQLLHNTIRLQSLKTTVCGQYCILFLILRSFLHLFFPISSNSSTLKPLQFISKYIYNLASTCTLRDKKVGIALAHIRSCLHSSDSKTPRIPLSFEQIDSAIPIRIQDSSYLNTGLLNSSVSSNQQSSCSASSTSHFAQQFIDDE